jgi:hypothetical protein
VPVQMSAWTKAYLGWVKPADVTTDMTSTTLGAFETTGDVLLVTIKPSDGNSYFLLSNRQRTGFDSKIPAAGLFVLRVNEPRLKSGLANNDVNVDPDNMGIQVVEADGLNKLVFQNGDHSFRGGPGDVFPGDSSKHILDNNSQPKTTGKIAVCNINADSGSITLSVFISRGSCPAETARSAPLEVTVDDLSRRPRQFLAVAVRVRGFLENESSNYFRAGLRLALRDQQGSKVSISSWLPREAPPGHQGPGPPVLAQFLNHSVELVGTLQLHAEAYVLDVHYGRLLD